MTNTLTSPLYHNKPHLHLRKTPGNVEKGGAGSEVEALAAAVDRAMGEAGAVDPIRAVAAAAAVVAAAVKASQIHPTNRQGRRQLEPPPRNQKRSDPRSRMVIASCLQRKK